MARTQLRLDSLTGSYGTGAGLIEQSKAKQASFAAMASEDLRDVLSDMASSIKRIHGVDFASQDAGIFNHSLMKITGSLGVSSGADIDGALDVALASDLRGAVHAYGTALVDGAATLGSTLSVAGGYGSSGVSIAADGALSMNGPLTVDGISTLTGNVAAAGSLTVGGGYGAAGVTLSDAGAVQMNGALTVDGASTLTGNVSAAGDLLIGGGYGSTGVTLSSAGVVQMNGALTVDGASTLTGAASLGSSLSVASTSALAGTVSIGGGYGATGITLSDAGVVQMNGALTVDGAASVGGNLTVTGDLVVNGTTTTVNSTILTVDDKNIELGSVASPSEATADGGGITLKGASDHSIIYRQTPASWEFSEHIVPAGLKDIGQSADRWQDLWLSRDAAVGGALSVVGAGSIGGTLGVTGVATFSSQVNIDALLDVDAASDFQGNVNMQGNLDVAGYFDAAGVSRFAGDMTLDSGADQNIFKTGGKLIMSASSDIRLRGGGDLRFGDVHSGSSTFVSGGGMKFAAAPAEWTSFVTNFGQVSLLSALNSAASGASAGKGKWVQTLAADVAASAAAPAFSSGMQLGGSSPAAAPALSTSSDIYLNGQLMVATSDYSVSGAAVTFVFPLKVDDVLIAVHR